MTASVGGTAMQAGELSQRKGQTVSFVIPVFNEEGSLGPLHAALAKVVDGLGADTEVIFIDDGSSDQSPKILDALAAVEFSRYGGAFAAQLWEGRRARRRLPSRSQ